MFLALLIGVVMGATVIDRATVDVLNQRIEGVQTNVDDTNQRNQELQAELDRWQRFATEADDELVADDLQGRPLLMITVAGTDEQVLESLEALLVTTGARLQGTLRLERKLGVDDDGAVQDLADALGADSTNPQDLQALAVSGIVRALTAPRIGSLEPFTARGFVEPPETAPPTSTTTTSSAVSSSTTIQTVDSSTVPMFVVVGDATPDVPHDRLLQPLADQLAGQEARVLVAEPVGERLPGEEPVLVGPIRAGAYERLRDDVSTVDNVDDFRGRMAVVLAARQLAGTRPEVGHYGIGPATDGLVPTSES